MHATTAAASFPKKGSIMKGNEMTLRARLTLFRCCRRKGGSRMRR